MGLNSFKNAKGNKNGTEFFKPKHHIAAKTRTYSELVEGVGKSTACIIELVQFYSVQFADHLLKLRDIINENQTYLECKSY